MNPTVSIIIPVYNAETYLRRCLDSVTGQEYTEFELLLVDDGSTDTSGAICDEYAKRDERVRVIHQENGGVSAARNLAMSQAKGEYLQFLDSDDWITPDATKLLVRTAAETGCDMVIADFYRVVGERVSQKGDIDRDGIMTQEEFAAQMMDNPADFYYGVLWNKLYRRDLVREHGLCMNTEISWCEDFMFNLEYIRYAKSFCALRAPIYYYVKRKGSLVSQGNSLANTIKMKLSVFEYYHSFYKHVLDDEEYEKSRLQVYRFFIDAAGDGMVGFPILPGTKRLGYERAGVSAGAMAGEGMLSELYRERKLMERYLEVAAIKNELTLSEAFLLLHLHHFDSVVTRKELADFAGISKSSLAILLQKLALKGFIRQEELLPEKGAPQKKEKRKAKGKAKEREKEEKQAKQAKKLRITFLPAAEPVLKELEAVQQDYDRARFAGFEEEDLIAYARLSEKVRRNMQKVLCPAALASEEE